MFTNATILVTGGTGSFGHAFLPMTLERFNPQNGIFFSRGAMKQPEMARKSRARRRPRLLDAAVDRGGARRAA